MSSPDNSAPVQQATSSTTSGDAKPEAPKLPFFRRQRARLVEFCRQLATDYKTVATEAVQGARTRPLRAALVFSAAGGIIAACATNPSEWEGSDDMVERRQRLTLVPRVTHNPKTGLLNFAAQWFFSDAAMELRTRLRNERRLEHIDLWVCSLLMRQDYGENKSKADFQMGLYAAHASALQDWPWQRWYRNFIDIGAFGRWWLLERDFADFDINTSEFPVEEEEKDK